MHILLQLARTFDAIDLPILVIHADCYSIVETAWQFRNEILSTYPVTQDCTLRTGPVSACAAEVTGLGSLVFPRLRANELHVWAGDLSDEDLLMRMGYELGRLLKVQLAFAPPDGLDDRELDGYGLSALLAARFLEEIREELRERRAIGQNREAVGRVEDRVGRDRPDDPGDGIHLGPSGGRD